VPVNNKRWEDEGIEIDDRSEKSDRVIAQSPYREKRLTILLGEVDHDDLLLAGR
jgi:hypothetical protein